MIARIKVWVSQITWGSAIAFITLLVTFVLHGPFTSLIGYFGIPKEIADRIHSIAVGLEMVIVWLARSPKQKPLFTTPIQVLETPPHQREEVIIRKADIAKAEEEKAEEKVNDGD